MTLTKTQRESLGDLAQRVRDHFESIEQDVPDQSFVVGGAVRDALLGLDAQDLDFVVVGETADTMEARGFEPIEASSFPVFHDDDHEEWALARTEQKTGDGYSGFEVFTDDVSLRDDLERRDLTVNAMALDIDGSWAPDHDNAIHWWNIECTNGSGPLLVDPHGGVQDLNDGVLRHVSEAFADDPLRILRVARYAGRFAVPPGDDIIEIEVEDDGRAELRHQFAFAHNNVVTEGFVIAEETEALMRQVAPELNRMSRDRIGMELKKAMRQARRPSRVFEALRDTGALAVLWPELDRGELVPAGPEKHHMEGSVFAHSMMVLDRMHELCAEHDITGHDRMRRLFMALAHDIGKVVCADEQGGLHSDDPPVRFGGHASIGAGLMEDTARRLGLGSELKNVMADGCELHMKFHDVPQMPANELLDFIDGHFPNGLDGEGMRELPTNDDGESHSFFRATAWEMLDVAHADHEGRFVQTFVDDGGGVTDTKRTGFERPEFDRETFETILEAVWEALEDVDGYEALERGLCDNHAECEIDRSVGVFKEDGCSVQSVMSSCPSCRTPGDWVGQQVEQMQVAVLQEVLDE